MGGDESDLCAHISKYKLTSTAGLKQQKWYMLINISLATQKCITLYQIHTMPDQEKCVKRSTYILYRKH